MICRTPLYAWAHDFPPHPPPSPLPCSRASPQGIKIARKVAAALPAGSKSKDFLSALEGGAAKDDIKALRAEVEAFATQFPMPGL